MRRKVRALFMALVLGQCFLAAGFAAAGETGTISVVAVIVNPNNPVSELSPDDIRRVYNNELLRWADGTPIKLYDLVVGDPARGVFSEKVLGMDAYEVADRWAHLKISNLAINPPVTVKSEMDIIRRVSQEKGAIGYVSLYLAKGSKDVRIIATLY